MVPILRSGGIAGGMLAIRLGVATLLPIQLKVAHRPERIVTVVPLPRSIPLPPRPRILVCDANCSTGATATEAVRQVRARWPGSRVVVAVLARVHGGPRRIEGAEALLHGIETDEGFLASARERKARGLRPGATLFPWERAAEELAELNAGTSPPPRVYHSTKDARRKRRPGGRKPC